MSHTIEGDGVALNVYHHMWKKKLNNIEDGFSVRLPHTVVYEHDFAKGWYFWSEKKEEIERRFGKEIESKAVLREFLQPTIAANGDRPRRRDGAQTECVAYYLSSRPNGGVAVDFLDAAELQEFLMKPSHTREHGILQQLVPAGGVSTTTIQAVWSPHVTLVEKRQNIHQAADRRLSLFDRMATYEGPPHLSRESAVPSRVHWQVQQLCETFTAHFQSTEHMAITRMVLYFRLDALGDLWFLWSSSIRVARAAQLQLSPRFGPPRSQLEADATTRQLLDAATKIPVPSLDTPSGETTHTQRVKSTPALPSLLERVTAAYADRSTMLRQNKALADFVAPRTAPGKSRVPFPPISLGRTDTFQSSVRDGSLRGSTFRSSVYSPKPRKERGESARNRGAPVLVQPRQAASDIWFKVRYARRIGYLSLLYAWDQLRDFTATLAYALSSHCMTAESRHTFRMSMPPSVWRMFGQSFAHRFRPLGVTLGPEVGAVAVLRPAAMVAPLRKELEDWTEDVHREVIVKWEAFFQKQVDQLLRVRSQRNSVDAHGTT